MTSNNSTQIIETASEYSLKYDEKTQGLRDKTYSELIKDHGSKIRCPCMNRIYPVTSQAIKSHFNCQKHENWVTKSQKEHIEDYGHCCSPQDIVNIQSKELRNLKRFIHDLTTKNETVTYENTKLAELIKSLQEEILLLKSTFAVCQEVEEEEEDDDETFVECS